MSDLEHTAIERIKAASDMSLQAYGLPLVVTDCDGCPVAGSFCDTMLAECAINWGLKDPPRWTEQEIDDAKTLLRMFVGECSYVHRRSARVFATEKPDSYVGIALDCKMFPSLRDGETAKLSEIVRYENG